MANSIPGLKVHRRYEDLIGVAVSDELRNIKFPNRDASFLRNGFILSQLDGEGMRQMEHQQEMASKQAYKEHLLKENFINEMNWIAPPAHLSYFTLETLSNLVEQSGYSIHNYYAEYPIDFDLLVDNTNYVKDKSVGKYSHLKRLRVDNFLCSQSISKTNEYYKKLAELNNI